jgi:hypothetical protein
MGHGFPESPGGDFREGSGREDDYRACAAGRQHHGVHGRAGWIAGANKPMPVLVVPAGKDLDGIRLDADLPFPGRIKQALGRWRVGFPETSIDAHDVEVLEGTTARGSRVKLFFYKKSGLLARLVRYTHTAVGIVPTQIDYSDYREVAGVKMPFHWTVAWTSGRSTTELSEIQANVPIDAAKFGRPAAPVRPKGSGRYTGVL